MQKFITPYWDDFYKNLDYEESLFRDPEQVKAWSDAGHHLPSTTIHVYQKPDTSPYTDIIKNFKDLKNVGVCIHKLLPGHYLPTHIDRYGFYRSKNNINDVNKVHRYVVFLEDWKDGHYLKVNDTIYQHWKRGDCIGWVGETPHSAVNLGTEDRYTLQITGEYEPISL